MCCTYGAWNIDIRMADAHGCHHISTLSLLELIR